MNNYIFQILFCSLFFLFQNFLSAQSMEVITAPVQVTQAVKIGTTPPVRDLVPVAHMSREKRKIVKSHRKAPDNFVGRGRYVSQNPNAQPQGEDRLWQKQIPQRRSMPEVPIINMDGISNNFGSPHDPTGDVGENHYLQAINATQLAVFNKTDGSLIQTFDANTLWSSLGFSSAGDPIILYDQEINRWLITEFPNGNQLLVAISDDSDPLGSYTAYNFSTPLFPDYPKYGIWNNAYVVTTNEGALSDAPVYLIDRMDMINGLETVDIQRIVIPGAAAGPGFQVDSPVDWSGTFPPMANTKPMVLSLSDDAWQNTSEDLIEIFSFDVDFNSPENTQIRKQELLLSPFDTNPCSVSGFGFQCVPQLGGDGLDALPETVMHQAHYRNFGSHESLVFNFIIDVTGGDNLSGIRWVELRKAPYEDDWTLYQEGSFAPDDGLQRFMGGIAIDGKGNIGLAYNVTSDTSYVGVKYTGRRVGDPLGQMTIPEVDVVDGSNTIESGGRFGDYAHMTIDPFNERTFWYTTEYAGGRENLSNTRIVAFEFADQLDMGPKRLLSLQDPDQNGEEETVIASFQNFGLDTITSFTVGYQFEDQAIVMDEVEYELLPDSVYVHTFEGGVNLSYADTFELVLFSSLEGDQQINNDTARINIIKIPALAADLVSFIDFNSQLCDTEDVTVSLRANNEGSASIENLLIEYRLNNVLQDTIIWFGEIPAISSGIVTLILPNLLGRENNTIAFDIIGINGEFISDLNTNTLSEQLSVVPNGATVNLQINFDNYASESSWRIEDENSNTLYSGGPYTNGFLELNEFICLDTTQCYTFIMVDSYGDGICCQYGQGSYTIANEQGELVVEGNGEFLTESVHQFCYQPACTLTATAVASNENEGNADGTILIETLNGTAPFEYSINEGQDFQNSAMFDGLSAGTYQILVRDARGCEATATATVANCALTLEVEVQNGFNDVLGVITINVEGGTAPYRYSIDNGDNYADTNVFENLEEGTYLVMVLDANDCPVSTEVVVDYSTNTATFTTAQAKIYPNPTDGAIRVELSGVDITNTFLDLQIINNEGKVLYETSIARYDDQYTGMVSFMPYPNGVYYLRFMHKDYNKLVKVVKN